MQNLGYKQITKETWLKPDRISTSFLLVPPETGVDDIKKGEMYLDMILQPCLNEDVPIEVRKLYEVARGALVYGYFFYPLYTLACEQLFRVGEAAITFRCNLINSRRVKRTFEKKIEFLFEQGILNDLEKQRWHTLRELRNIASHPEDQSIYPPGPIIGILIQTVEDINKLFSEKKRII
jgi:hypothetical protein